MLNRKSKALWTVFVLIIFVLLVYGWSNPNLLIKIASKSEENSIIRNLIIERVYVIYEKKKNAHENIDYIVKGRDYDLKNCNRFEKL